MRSKAIFIALASCILSGCATEPKKNATAPSVNEMRPTYMDAELIQLTAQLVDKQAQLANIRQTKQAAFRTPTHRQKLDKDLSGMLFSGLEIKRDIDCPCDLKIAMQGIAANLGWDVNDVYEYGRKPAQGVVVHIKIKQQPLVFALEQTKQQTAHIATVRLDPNYKTILIKYKNLVGK